jgi:hypothetical protein
MNPIAWAFRSLRDRGVIRTVVVAHSFLCNWWFDIRNHTNTARVSELHDLDIASDNIRFGNKYQASKARPLRMLLDSLQLPPNSVFVDFGSGKGKAMLVASEFPFGRVVGVEFSRELCAQAHLNLRRYVGERYGERLFVFECDAAQYEFRDDENVLYFYNPFKGQVIERVLIQLQESLVRSPRNVWVLYMAPLHCEAFDRCKILELDAALELRGTDCRIYSHRTPVMHEGNECAAERVRT